jgi:hypothetical protein
MGHADARGVEVRRKTAAFFDSMCALDDTLLPCWPVQLIYNHNGSRNVLNEAFFDDFRPSVRAIGPFGGGLRGCCSGCRLWYQLPASDYAC